MDQIVSIGIEFQLFWLAPVALGLVGVGVFLGVVVHRRLTQARLAREQHLAAKENYLQTIYLLSHEFSTPTQTILNSLDNLASTSSQSEDWHRNHALALEETRRMSQLINDMRLLAHVETSGSIRLQPVNLGAVIQSALIKFSDQAENLKVDVQFEGPERLPPVLGDRTQLEHVMENLLSNAIKYRRAEVDCKVVVSATVEDERIWVRVSDNGRGIAPEDLPHIFSPKFRTPEAAVSKRQGIGLGLAIVKRIIEQHKGEISVRSQLNEYTIFSFWLPRHSA
jgi:signal transduction histidine kinase